LNSHTGEDCRVTENDDITSTSMFFDVEISESDATEGDIVK